MRGGDGNVMRHEFREAPPEREVGAQMLHAAENRRMVRDDHVRPAFDRLIHDGIVHVERDHEAVYFLGKAPDEKPGIVPILGKAARRDAFEGGHDGLNT